MHWHFRRLTYNILIPKLDKNIYELNESETAEYFEWFMGKVPERVCYVAEICSRELGVSEERLNCTPESLLFIWKWFRQRAKTEGNSGFAIGKMVGKNQEVEGKKQQFTLETEYIIRDIGMYLGETLRRARPDIYWTYYTKPSRDFFVNHPVLRGFIDNSGPKPFEATFEPIHMVRTQAIKILKHKSKEDDLLNLFNVWYKMK